MLNLHPICTARWSHPICTKSIYRYYLNNHTICLEYGSSEYFHHNINLVGRASIYNNIIIVEWCFKNGYNAKAENNTLLYSIFNGHFKIAHLLLNNGADVHIYNDYALLYAIKNNRINVVQFLIGHGADVHAQNDRAFQLAIENNNTEIIKLLQNYKRKEESPSKPIKN